MDHMHGVSTIFLKHCDMVMSLLWGVGATRWAARLAAPISDGGPQSLGGSGWGPRETMHDYFAYIIIGHFLHGSFKYILITC